MRSTIGIPGRRTETASSRHRGRRAPALAVLAILALARTALAQDDTSGVGTLTGAPRPAGPQPEITLIARVGFDPDLSIVKRGSWTRISVLMSNTLRPVQGYLRIRKRDKETIIYHERIDLPLPSKKLWTGYVLADDDPNELLVEYYTTRWRLLASEPVTYKVRPVEDDLVLAIIPELRRAGMRSFVDVVARDPDAPFVMEERRRTGVKGRQLLFTDKSLLPRETLGYESISAFLWDGGDLTELDPERSLALKTWVYQGGTLIVAGGANKDQVKQSFLNEILPVEILETASADLTEDLRQLAGSSPATGEPTQITTVRVTRGRTLMGTPQRPLIVEGPYGAGRVVYVAFSLTSWALQKWDGRDALLNRIFKPNRSHLLGGITGMARYTIDTRLKSNLLAELPTPYFIIAFLGLYILLVVPVNYFVFRAFKRVEYAWFALPVVAVAFGFMAYNIGYFSQSRTLDADEISFVEGMAGSPVVAAKSFCAIYSPTGTNETIRFPDVPVFSRPLLAVGFGQMMRPGSPDSMRLARNPLILTYTNGFDVSDFVINTWAARSLECDLVTDLGGQIDATLAFDGSDLSGTIANHLGYALNDPILVMSPERVYGLSNVSGGVSIMANGDVRTFSSLGSLNSGWRSASGDQGLQQWMVNLLNQSRRSTAAEHGYQGVPFMPFFENPGAGGNSWFGGYSRLVPTNSCLLLAWAPRSVIKPSIGQGRSKRNLNNRSQTIIHMFILPFDLEASRLTAVSEGLWAVVPVVGKLDRLSRERDYALQDYMRARPTGVVAARLLPGQNLFVLRPTIELGERVLDSLTISMVLEKKTLYQSGSGSMTTLPDSGFAVSLMNFKTNAWEPFGAVRKLECQQDADRFCSPAGKELSMKVEVTDPEIQVLESGGYRPNAKNGFLRDVKVNATLK